MDMKKLAVTKIPQERSRPKAKKPQPRRTPRKPLSPADPNGLFPFPAPVQEALQSAARTGKWLIAVCRIENEKLFVDRTAMNFPHADLDLVCRLFVENVSELKSGKSSSAFETE
jgi:hypothetical protein